MKISVDPPIFEVTASRTHSVPIIASIPHSGMYVPPNIAVQFTPNNLAWLRNTDWFIPEVFSFLPDLGITTIAATHSRYVVDLNRDASGELYGPFGSAPVAQAYLTGEPTHLTQPDDDELAARIRKYHEPYHQALEELLAKTVENFGFCLLLDLHAFMGPSENDICLGNLRGTASNFETLRKLQKICEEEGFTTAANNPFAGAYILCRHHNEKTQAIQLELRYTNYMDCSRIDEPIRPELHQGMLHKLRPRLALTFDKFIKNMNNESWQPLIKNPRL